VLLGLNRGVSHHPSASGAALPLFANLLGYSPSDSTVWALAGFGLPFPGLALPSLGGAGFDPVPDELPDGDGSLAARADGERRIKDAKANGPERAVLVEEFCDN